MKRQIGVIGVCAAVLTGCHSVPDGCSGFPGQTCISLEVISGVGAPASVSQISVESTTTAFGLSAAAMSPPTASEPPFSLPVVVPILPAQGFSGEFSLHVGGLLGGVEIAAADVDGAIAPGAHIRLRVALGGSSASDLGSDDLSGSDAAADDMANSNVAPRPIAPPSSSFVTSRRPVFKWVLPTGYDGGRVEICSSIQCSTVVSSFDVTGASGRPPSDLPPRAVVYWRLRGLVGTTPGAVASATWQMTTPAVSATNASTWGTVPDFDGDGYADVPVAARLAPSSGAGDGPGRVYIFEGGAWSAVPPPAVTLTGGANGDQFGWGTDSAGDVNGDGLPDLVVGACSEQAGQGGIYVYYGKQATGLSSQNSTHFGSGGCKVHGLGDVDGDGYADIGAMSADYKSVAIYRGSAGGISSTPEWTLAAPPGVSLIDDFAGIGDANGDGFSDVAFAGRSATTVVSYVFVFLGGPSGGFTAGQTPQPASTITAPNQGGVHSAGDVNGDGFPDFAVDQVMYNNGAGRVLVYYGSATGVAANQNPSNLAYPLSAQGDELGSTVSAVGDIDGDGLSDLVVTAYNAPTMSGMSGPGQAYVFYGKIIPAPGMSLQTAPTIITIPNGMVGDYVSIYRLVGDINHDGYADVVLSTPRSSNHTGLIDVLLGSVGGISTSGQLFVGPDGPGGWFGQ